MQQKILLPTDCILFFTGHDSQDITVQLQGLLEQHPWHPEVLVQHNSAIDKHGTCRLFIMADSLDELGFRVKSALKSLQRGVKREGRIGKGVFYSNNCKTYQGGIAFVFPGQGCQYPGMGKALAQRYPSVNMWIRMLDEALIDVVGEPVSSYFFDGTYAGELHPQLFALDIGACIVNTLSLAYHELVMQMGIQPDVYLGHSTGEFTALMASGKVKGGNHSHTFGSIYYQFMMAYHLASTKHKVPQGTLYSVGMLDLASIQACFPEAAKGIYIALDNCPNQKIVFCPNQFASSLHQSLQDAGGLLATMPFTYAYHTPLFADMNQALYTFYKSLVFQRVKCVLYSAITAKPFPDDDEETRKLASILLQEKVCFQDTIETICERENIRTFLEIGPRNNTSAFMNDILREKPVQVLSTGQANIGEVEAFLQMVGQLFVAGKLHDIGRLYSNASEQVFGQHKQNTQEAIINKNNNISQDSESKPSQAEKALMLQVHFDLMQSFLEQQTRVMTLLNGLQQDSQPLKQSNQEKPIAPMLGIIVSRDAGKAFWQREVRLEKETYLLDHTFGGFPSLRDKHKTALPVIPFTFSMETIVEAAVELAGEGYVVQRVFDVRALHWFVYLGQPLMLDIQAQFLNEYIILCRIFNLQGGKRKLSFESKVEVSNLPATKLAEDTVEIHNEIKTPYHKGNFYLDKKPCSPWVASEFHGTAFQAVESIIATGKNGIVAELRVPSRKSLFQSTEGIQLQIDPVMVDASMHLTQYWLHTIYGVDSGVLPFQVGSYTYFESPLPEGEKVMVKARVNFVQVDGSDLPDDASYRFFDVHGRMVAEHLLKNKQQQPVPKTVAYHQLHPDTVVIQSDVLYFNQRGKLIAKLEERLDKHFSVPRAYSHFTEHPSYYFLSTLETSCAYITPLDTSFLLGSGKVWLYKLAWLIFTPEEWEVWIAMDEAKGLDFVYRNIVCKDLVRMYLLEAKQERFAPVDIRCQLVNGEKQVYLCLVTLDDQNLNFTVYTSLSDKGVYQACFKTTEANG